MRFLVRRRGSLRELRPQETHLQGEQISLAYIHQSGASPGLLFVPGYHSDMQSRKAQAISEWAAEHGYSSTRFDYQGHGHSSGKFEDGTLGCWIDDALAVLDSVTEGPQILIGSSMGGWIAIRLALLRPHRIVGLIGIAAAPDFTEDLITPSLTDQQRLQSSGVLVLPDDDFVITAEFMQEARQHLVLREELPINIPVRLLHGMADQDVPWSVSRRLAECLTGTDVRLTLIKDGQHRLSRESDLKILRYQIGELVSSMSRG